MYFIINVLAGDNLISAFLEVKHLKFKYYNISNDSYVADTGHVK